MVKLSVAAAALFLGTNCNGFVIPSKSFTKTTTTTASLHKRTTTTSKNTLSLATSPDVVSAISDVTSTLLSYSDDPIGDQFNGANALVIGGTLVTFIGIGFGFKALLPSVGKTSFILTPEEEDAISRVENGYDAQAWEKEITEEGTKGYVSRRNQAADAKESYRESAGRGRDVKDKSLRYAETDLGFVASLIRAAEPTPGDLFVDLGSGCGRSTLGAAAAFPSFAKCIGVEFLEPLVKKSQGYKNKVRGRKAPVDFVNADFAEYDLSDADVVFASATYFNNGDFEKALQTLSSGAKVLTIDKRLGGGFQLITEVEDPNRDLVLNTGYVYQKL